MIKVSVVIPVYNEEKYLRQCLDSIQNQTLKEIEIILVDDGSTDSSVSIIKEYVDKDSRFQLRQQRNLYAGMARNNGMKDARGEYIIFLDADDFFIETMLEELYIRAIETRADVVICDTYIFDEKTKEISEPTWYLKDNLIPREMEVFSYRDIPDYIFQITIPVPWNKLIRKEFIIEANIHFQSIKRNNDIFFGSIAMVCAERISLLAKRLLYYRCNNIDSLQGMREENISYDFYTALINVKKELIKRKLYKTLYISFANKALSSCINFLKRQIYLKNFRSLYNFLKSKAFTDLGIKELNKENIYSEYEYQEYMKILDFSIEEYLFSYFIKNLGDRCRFPFPYEKIGTMKNIAIYGAGVVGKAYWSQLIQVNYYTLIAWFDKNYIKYKEQGLPVIAPEKINKYEFDIIVIAIEDRTVARSVYHYIKEQGIKEEKIIYGMCEFH